MLTPRQHGTTRNIPCQRHDLPATASEKQIFYYLGVGHVFFNREKSLLYFSDLEQTPVIPVLDALYLHQPGKYRVEQMFLDTHGYWFGGYRVHLPELMCKPLLVALRLKGIMISYVLAAEPEAIAPPPDSLPG
ncbi:MAG: hypothetical protein R3E89_08035 [Thiolinea sp.]